jgi:hypothetical protein
VVYYEAKFENALKESKMTHVLIFDEVAVVDVETPNIGPNA